MVDLEELVYMASKHIGDGDDLLRDAFQDIYDEFCKIVPDTKRQKAFKRFLDSARR